MQKPTDWLAEQPWSIYVLVSFPKSNNVQQGNNIEMIELCGVNINHSCKVWRNATK